MSSALLIGSSGLVGSHLLSRLLASPRYDDVACPVRRLSGRQDAKLREVAINFDDLDRYADEFRGDDVFCTLGTTIRTAGSQAAFRRVDYTYPVEVAARALRNGATRFFVVSSIGADPNSRVFYSRVKGEMERTISSMPYASISIFRPSLLLGERKEKRAGEQVGSVLMRAAQFAMVGPMRKYRPIHADTVAAAMIAVAGLTAPGLRIYESDSIEHLGKT